MKTRQEGKDKGRERRKKIVYITFLNENLSNNNHHDNNFQCLPHDEGVCLVFLFCELDCASFSLPSSSHSFICSCFSLISHFFLFSLEPRYVIFYSPPLLDTRRRCTLSFLDSLFTSFHDHYSASTLFLPSVHRSQQELLVGWIERKENWCRPENIWSA